MTEIEHIGSTPVPGLAAKPVIDLMAAVAELGSVEQRAETLADQARVRPGLPLVNVWET